MLSESGDILIPLEQGIITKDDFTGDLGQVIKGEIVGRENDEEIIVFETVGVATQDPVLRERLKVDAAAARVANFLNCSLEELKTFARITGHENVHDLSLFDLCTISREISEFTDIVHA